MNLRSARANSPTTTFLLTVRVGRQEAWLTAVRLRNPKIVCDPVARRCCQTPPCHALLVKFGQF